MTAEQVSALPTEPCPQPLTDDLLKSRYIAKSGGNGNGKHCASLEKGNAAKGKASPWNFLK